MKFKMAERSLFAILLRSPWWISFIVAAIFITAARLLLPDPYFSFGAMGSGPFIVIGVMAAWRQLRAPSPTRVASTMEALAAMPWRDFANAVESAFQRHGYTVTRLSGSAADFSIHKAGATTLVSGKRWKAASVGIEGLRELVAARQQQDASACQILTLGTFSEAAASYAREHGIKVAQGENLALLLMPLPTAPATAAAAR